MVFSNFSLKIRVIVILIRIFVCRIFCDGKIIFYLAPPQVSVIIVRKFHNTRVQVTTTATQTDSTFNGMQKQTKILLTLQLHFKIFTYVLFSDSDYHRYQDTQKSKPTR